MAVYDKKIKISLIAYVILIAIAIILVLAYYYYNTEENSRLNILLGGLTTGFVVALVQLFLSWYEYKTIEKFKAMKVKDILSNRDERDFYGKLIMNAKNKIDVMGVTASRFIEDFADDSSARSSSKVLLAAMSNGVAVRVLVPDSQFLDDEKQKDVARHTKAAFESIKLAYPRFEYRYFSHSAAHSIFIIDDESILGPVFPGISSKDTPAIYLGPNSLYAKKYFEYFDHEWVNATV